MVQIHVLGKSVLDSGTICRDLLPLSNPNTKNYTCPDVQYHFHKPKFVNYIVVDKSKKHFQKCS